MQPPSLRSGPSDWVSIGRASQLLGVNPATLRQWTTRGKVHAYRTPGGHRRFSALELASLAEAATATSPPRLGETVIHQLRQRYHTVAQSAGTHERWIADLSEATRQRFHELGDSLLARLGAYVTTTNPRERRIALGEARGIAADYGQTCRDAGLDTAQAIEAYVLFRRPVLDVLGKALAAHPDQSPQISRILRDAERFLNEVLERVAGSSQAHQQRERAS